MLLDHDPVSGKPIGKRLPKSMRPAAAEAAQERAMLHWPRHILKRNPDVVSAISQATAELGGPTDFSEIYGHFDWESHGRMVDRVMVSGLNDERLAAALEASPNPNILFTGGGIVRSGLLGISEKQFLHIHPGHLPDVRGADGLLCSYLDRGRPGASVFYMAEGIDTGDVVAVRDYSRWTIPLESRPDDATLYRSVFSFIDPVMRGALLVETLRNATDPNALRRSPQDLAAGTTYHFLHRRLRTEALRMLFPHRDELSL